VVIYARGNEHEVEEQQERCRTTAEYNAEQVVGLATDTPFTMTGWESANQMVRDGDADKVLVSSRMVIPRLVESVTGQFKGRRPRRIE
jgi:hypothetical protein